MWVDVSSASGMWLNRKDVMGKSMKNMVGVSVLKSKIRQSWCGGGQGKYSGGVLEYFYLRSCKTEFSMICFMEKGKNI